MLDDCVCGGDNKETLITNHISMKTNKIIMALSLAVVFLSGCKKEEESQLPEVKTYEATVTIASVILSGEVVSENGEAVTTRGFCWSRNPNPELNDSVVLAGMGPGEFNYTLDGFTASETYYYKAFATNASGTSFGAEMSFTPQGQPGNPTIVLKQGPSYVSSDTEITVGNSILVGINGAKNEFSPHNLNRFRFSITSNLVPIVFVDTVFNAPNYSWEVQLTFTGIGQAQLRFEIWDKGGNRVEEQLFITVKEQQGSAVNKFPGIELGSFNDAIDSFYPTTDDVVYTTNALISNPAALFTRGDVAAIEVVVQQ